MYTFLNNNNILQSCEIGIESEFYSSLTRKNIAYSLSKYLNKTIFVVNKYHGKQTVDSNNFKLEYDFSGGSKMSELVTGVMSYSESKIIIIKILKWIEHNGWTTDKCAFQINISFNKNKIIKTKMSHLNVLKFVLNFDEELIYNSFPNRRNNIYAQSIKYMLPFNKFIYSSDVFPKTIFNENFKVPDSKYYGVNFSKIKKNYLEFRYIGGEGYQKKYLDIFNLIDYYIIFTHNILLNNNVYTNDDYNKVVFELDKFKKATKVFTDIKYLYLNYPNIKLLVNLKDDIQIIKSYYNIIKGKLYDLLVYNGLEKGVFNYDSDLSVFQLKDGILNKAFSLNDIQLFNCEVSGILNNVDLNNCKVSNSHIINCQINDKNTVVNSKIMNTDIKEDNIVDDCYIDNKNNLLLGTFTNCIIRHGLFDDKTKIDDSNIIVKKIFRSGSKKK